MVWWDNERKLMNGNEWSENCQRTHAHTQNTFYSVRCSYMLPFVPLFFPNPFHRVHLRILLSKLFVCVFSYLEYGWVDSAEIWFLSIYFINFMVAYFPWWHLFFILPFFPNVLVSCVCTYCKIHICCVCVCVFSHVHIAHILLVKLISTKETGSFLLLFVRIQGGNLLLVQTIYFGFQIEVTIWKWCKRVWRSLWTNGHCQVSSRPL